MGLESLAKSAASSSGRTFRVSQVAACAKVDIHFSTRLTLRVRRALGFGLKPRVGLTASTFTGFDQIEDPK